MLFINNKSSLSRHFNILFIMIYYDHCLLQLSKFNTLVINILLFFPLQDNIFYNHNICSILKSSIHEYQMIWSIVQYNNHLESKRTINIFKIWSTNSKSDLIIQSQSPLETLYIYKNICSVVYLKFKTLIMHLLI